MSVKQFSHKIKICAVFLYSGRKRKEGSTFGMKFGKKEEEEERIPFLLTQDSQISVCGAEAVTDSSAFLYGKLKWASKTALCLQYIQTVCSVYICTTVV